jgi:hypothetical protein
MSKLIGIFGLLVFPKTYQGQLSPNLKHREFKCQCNRKSCHYTMVSKHVVEAFQKVRDEFGEPLKVNSGYRCQEHNKDQPKSVPHSRHTLGLAIDINTRNMSNKFRGLLISLCHIHFDVVLEYKTFIHCHMEPDNAEKKG